MTQSDTGLTGRGSEVASSTKGHASDVASSATEQAKGVAQEAKQQGRDLLNEARSTVTTQASGQKDRAAGQLRTVANDLRTMQEGGGAPSGPTGELVRQASQQTERLAGWLESREPADILDDVRSFARQRPGVFLLSCLAAGFVVGRVVKGATSGDSSSSRAGQYRTYPSSRLTGDYASGYSTGYTGATTVGSDLGTGTGSAYATTGTYAAGDVAATPVYDETTTTYDTGAEDAATSTAAYPDQGTGDPWQDDDARRSTQGGSGV
jgi:hypothetical protein